MEMDEDGKRDDIAILYSNGTAVTNNKINIIVAGFWQNCTQKFSTVTSTCSGDIRDSCPDPGIHTLTGAELRAIKNSSGNYNRVMAMYSHAKGSPPPLRLFSVNSSGNIVWSGTGSTLAQAETMAVNDFRSEDAGGDEIIVCAKTDKKCDMFLYNGTKILTGTLDDITVDQYELPVGKIGSSSYASFARSQKVEWGVAPDPVYYNMTLNMTNGTFGSNWVWQNNNLTSQYYQPSSASTGNFDGNGDDDFCFAVQSNSTDYKIFCLNNSGSEIGNFSIQSTTGNRWGKGCMKTIDKDSTNFPGDLLVACDTSGYGYLFTLTQEPKGGLISTQIGKTPFYTNVTNPINITLNKDQCQNVTWWVNATGMKGAMYEFFAYANLTANMAISNQTSKVNITIVQN